MQFNQFVIFSGDLDADTSDFNDDFEEDLMSTYEVQEHVVKIPCLQHFMYTLLDTSCQKKQNTKKQIQKQKLKQNNLFVKTKCLLCIVFWYNYCHSLLTVNCDITNLNQL